MPVKTLSKFAFIIANTSEERVKAITEKFSFEKNLGKRNI